jgi:glycosyltransferase involved in cell wall biosynthesis
VLTAVRSHAQGADLSLVLAGRTDARRAFALGRQAERWGVADALRMVGPLDAPELAAALSGADALLVTGRHEGFSIPLVDAQQCGVPVVAVRSGALAEVGGDGVWLAGPEDVPGLAAAVLDATTPSDLCESRLRRGRKLAARWSWETSARALEAALENCVQG